MGRKFTDAESQRGRDTRSRNIRETHTADPHYCKQCNKLIEARDGERLFDARRRKFCNNSCSAKFNNKDNCRHSIPSGPCQECGETVYYRKGKGAFHKRKYCSICLAIKKLNGRPAFDSKTKGEAIVSAGHPAYAYNEIRAKARIILKKAGRTKCEAPGCGYDKHVQASHIRDIAEFPDTALVSEINDPKNLAALCPTHHWELDHGIIAL
jgi:hypothetical protein